MVHILKPRHSAHVTSHFRMIWTLCACLTSLHIGVHSSPPLSHNLPTDLGATEHYTRTPQATLTGTPMPARWGAHATLAGAPMPRSLVRPCHARWRAHDMLACALLCLTPARRFVSRSCAHCAQVFRVAAYATHVRSYALCPSILMPMP